FDLKEMVLDGTIASVGGLLEPIFRFARTYTGTDLLAAFYKSPSLPESKLVPVGVRQSWRAAKLDWNGGNYPGVLHGCASAFEAMAKHLSKNPKVEKESLGSFFELYRKKSGLDPSRLNRVWEIYNLRNTVRSAGHG